VTFIFTHDPDEQLPPPREPESPAKPGCDLGKPGSKRQAALPSADPLPRLFQRALRVQPIERGFGGTQPPLAVLQIKAREHGMPRAICRLDLDHSM
jgi:hypothetical protein